MKFVCDNRHTGMDCRYPGHKDVIWVDLPWPLDSGIPCRNDGLLADTTDEFPVEDLAPPDRVSPRLQGVCAFLALNSGPLHTCGSNPRRCVAQHIEHSPPIPRGNDKHESSFNYP